MHRVPGRWIGGATLALLLAARLAAAQGPVIQVSDAWIRPAPAGKTSTSAAYFTLRNTGPLEDTLLTVATEAAGAAELHEVVRLPDGMMRMQPRAQGIPIPPRSEVQLKPGGFHVMLIGFKKRIRPGARLTLTLRFAKSGPVTVTAIAAQRAGGNLPSVPEHAGKAHGAKK